MKANSTLIFLIFLMLSTPIFSATTQRRKVESQVVKRLKKELEGSNLILKGSIHQNPKTYYESQGELFYYEHSRVYPVLFRIKEDEPVKVTGVRARNDEVEIHLLSDRVGKGVVKFSSPLHSPVVTYEIIQSGMEICFGTGVSSSPITGNTISQVYHISGSNHLPKASNRHSFASKKAAEDQGFSQCKLCFLHVPVVSDYSTERLLGLYVSQQVRSAGQLSTNDQLQKRANDIGQRVLKNWPVPLQGYNYRFFVMEDDEVNAYAVPTGFVYVNRGLIQMAESDLEIEGVIAHEIGHVERRHSYRIYRNVQKRQRIAQGIGFIVGALAGAKGNKAEKALIFGTLAAGLANAVANVVFEDYPRSMEEEADAMAALYLQNHYGNDGLESMVTVLKKLRYYGDYLGTEQKQLTAFRTHPLLDDRIASFTGSSVHVFDHPLVIVGTNKRGQEVVRLELTSQRQTSPDVAGRYSLDPTQILGHVTATADINKPRKFKDIILTMENGKKVKLDNKEDSLIGPYEDQGFLLRGDLTETVDALNIKKVLVTLPGSGLKWSLEQK